MYKERKEKRIETKLKDEKKDRRGQSFIAFSKDLYVSLVDIKILNTARFVSFRFVSFVLSSLCPHSK